MSYTTRVILISLSVWLLLSLLCGVIMGFSGDEYWTIGILIAGMLIGLTEIVGLIVVGAVILLGKFPGRKLIPPGKDAPLDAQPTRLTYRERGLAYLAAAGVILMIGGSICFGML